MTDDYEGKLEVRSQDTLDALTQVARALAVVPGRKNLIWISGGFPFDSLTNGDRLQRVSALLAATRIAVYPVDLRGMQSMQADGQTRDSEIFARVQTQVYETIAHLDEENRPLIETMQNVAQITGGHTSTEMTSIAQWPMRLRMDPAITRWPTGRPTTTGMAVFARLPLRLRVPEFERFIAMDITRCWTR